MKSTILGRIDAAIYHRFGARLTSRIEHERGRRSITLRLWHEKRPESARLHISLGSRFLHAYFTPEKHDDTFVASVAVPGVAVWFSADLHPLAPFAQWCRRNAERETGVHVYLPDQDHSDLRVHWRLHSPSNEWSSATPKWRDGSVNVSDVVLGDSVRSTRIVTEREVDVPMPERTYRWKVSLRDETWKRPRSPFSTHRRRAHCDALPGEQIPFPGKGENAWDCDDDATYGMTTSAYSVADAVGAIVKSVTSTRIERGWEWKPAANEVVS